MRFPRIVASQPSVSVTLAALGRLDHLAACTKWCVEQVPELTATNLQILADSWSATKENLAAVDADLIIASVPYRLESLAAILQQGRPVLALAPKTLADIYSDTRLIASLTGADPQPLIANMEQALAEVGELCKDCKPQRLYAEEWGKPLIHSQPWVNELAEVAGGTPVGHPGEHSTPEEIAAADPDVIILAWCGAGDRVPLESAAQQRNWQNLRAVRERKMFCIPDEFLNTPAIPSLLDGLVCIAAAIHPEIFPPPPRLRAIYI